MTNTREVGLVLTILNHFHPFPSGPLAQSTRDRGWATYFVAQSKRGWPISPKWFLAGAALEGGGGVMKSGCLPSWRDGFETRVFVARAETTSRAILLPPLAKGG